MYAHVTPVQLNVAEVAVMVVVVRAVGAPHAVTARLLPLLPPKTTGLLLTTLMRYFVPPFELVGMAALIVPELAVLLNVPIATGALKLPLLLEICAV